MTNAADVSDGSSERGEYAARNEQLRYARQAARQAQRRKDARDFYRRYLEMCLESGWRVVSIPRFRALPDGSFAISVDMQDAQPMDDTWRDRFEQTLLTSLNEDPTEQGAR